MVSADLRFELLCQGISSALLVPLSNAAELVEDRHVCNFVTDNACMLLLVSYDVIKKSWSTSTTIDPMINAEQDRIFVAAIKSKFSPLTASNLNESIRLHTVRSANPCQDLYYILRDIFNPILQRGNRLEVDEDSRRHASEMEKVLSFALSRMETCGVTRTIREEEMYWFQLARTDSRNKSQVSAIQKSFSAVSEAYEHIDSLEFPEVRDLLDRTQDVLDDIWKHSTEDLFSQERMQHIFSILTHTLIRYVKLKMDCNHGTSSLWTISFEKFYDIIMPTLDLFELLHRQIYSLTTQFWQHGQRPPWKITDSLSVSTTNSYVIIEVRQVEDQLKKLLSTSDMEDVDTEPLKVFDMLNALDIDAQTQTSWDNAVKLFYSKLSVFEMKVSKRLGSHLSALRDQPEQFLNELYRYKTIMLLSNIYSEISPEVELLAQNLINFIRTTKNELSHLQSATSVFAHTFDSSDVVCRVSWIRQNFTRITAIFGLMKETLTKTRVWQSLVSETESLITGLKEYEQRFVKEWLVNAEESYKSGNLSLSESGKLLELNVKNGLLETSFSDKMISFVHDIRFLTSCGYSIPAKLQDSAQSMIKVYRYGVVLKQIAHFYNTIDRQMIKSQQPMLLDMALTFERLIKSSKEAKSAVTWNSANDVDTYVSQLQAAVGALSAANRYLRHQHQLACGLISALISIDIYKAPNKWKESLTNLRTLTAQVQRGPYRQENMQAWLIHLDHQIYKSLEYQYTSGLCDLAIGLQHEDSPYVKYEVEVVVKSGAISLKPPLEELRLRMYRDLRKFIMLPNTFWGVRAPEKGEAGHAMFASIIHRGARHIAKVFAAAEASMKHLSTYLTNLEEWNCFAASENLSSLIDDMFDGIGDWEQSFKSIKVKGRESENLEHSVKLGCFTISTLPLKASIDDFLQRLSDSIISALKKAVQCHVTAIESFIQRGSKALSSKPQSIDEIGESNQIHSELRTEMDDLKIHFDKVSEKVRLLKRTFGYSSSTDVIALQSKWEKFELLLNGHNMMIQEQVNSLKSTIGQKCDHFENQLSKLQYQWEQYKLECLHDNDTNHIVCQIEKLSNLHSDLDNLQEKVSGLEREARYFDLEFKKTMIEGIAIMVDEMAEHEKLLLMYRGYMEELDSIMNEEWITLRSRIARVDNFCEQWTDKAKTVIQKCPHDFYAIKILNRLDLLRMLLPNLKFLRGDRWAPENWIELFNLIHVEKKRLEDVVFQDIASNADRILSEIQNIKNLNTKAQAESNIRESLQELDVWASCTYFKFFEYKLMESTGSPILNLIKDWTELLSQIGDQRSLIQSLKDSNISSNFIEKIKHWDERLTELDSSLVILNGLQRRWLHLYPIFSADGTASALPNELKRFRKADDEFRALISFISVDSRVTRFIQYPNLQSMLSITSEQFERSQKALNEFLEIKRAKFPRFYFVGDEDLLEIIGQCKNLSVLQAHLRKMFAGVHSIELNQDCGAIIKIKSSDGETVSLLKEVNITDHVEEWLQTLTDEISHSLSHLLVKCYENFNIELYPQQIVDVCYRIIFTDTCEAILNLKKLGEIRPRLEKYSESLNRSLQEYSSFDFSTDPLMGLKIKSLIMDTILYIDILNQLKVENAVSPDDWCWKRQLRFYLDSNTGICKIKMGLTQFEYTFEYQGNVSKLVHTPLTDRCYLTLTQAIANGYGGCPYGPAGTGKTESIKSLGYLFGRIVLVFNCDEGLDYRSMGRLFTGIVRCGAWGCFDEFNRLEKTVLSSVSQQIQSIQHGLMSALSSITLIGSNVDLNRNASIFVTLNPAGKGYGGRQKLPDNLKQLFRSIAMSKPDLVLISQVLLLSEGYMHGRLLGSKLVSLFDLCRRLLSSQQHYDWGLRALKSVLREAGFLKSRGRSVGTEAEFKLMVEAVRLNCTSKLTPNDLQRFESFLSDLFPVTEIDDMSTEFKTDLVTIYDESKLTYDDYQIDKVRQLMAALNQRFGVVLYGKARSGKSTVLKLLKNYISKRKSLHTNLINPKAMDKKRLLGYLDPDTREWFDGVLTKAVRVATLDPTSVTWIVLDGDIDPVWIEALNSVLDDNHLLTLPSGERIQLGSNVRFIFETDSLKSASPATISRLGMIYFAEPIRPRLLIQSWLMLLSAEARLTVEKWLQDYVEPYLPSEGALFKMDQLDSYLNIFPGLSNHIGTKDSFLATVFHSISLNMGQNQRQLVEKRYIASMKTDPPKSMFFSYYDREVDAVKTFDCILNESDLKQSVSDAGSLVMTADVRRNIYLLGEKLRLGCHVLLIGSEGCGRNQIIQHFSHTKTFSCVTIDCNAHTGADFVIQSLSQYSFSLTSGGIRVIRPKSSEKLVVHLRNIHIAKADSYESVQLHSFVQQIITHGGFYDSELSWTVLENIQLVCSTTIQGLDSLSERLKHSMRHYYISAPNANDLIQIYSNSLLNHLKSICKNCNSYWSQTSNCTKLATTVTIIFEEYCKKFGANFIQSKVSPRNLSQMCDALEAFDLSDTDDPTSVLQVIIFEIFRMFGDRLRLSHERICFIDIVSRQFRTDWNFVYNEDTLYRVSKSIPTFPYRLICVERKEFVRTIEHVLTSFKREQRETGFLLSPHSVDLLMSIIHVLAQDNLSLFMIGRPGCGRKSSLGLAVTLLNMQMFTSNVVRPYSVKNFQNDLKIAIQSSVLKAERAVFFVEDFMLLNDDVVAIINGIVSSGDASMIYNRDELNLTLSVLKESSQAESYTGSLYDFFRDCIRRYLTIVLCLDEQNPNFSRFCETNPALVSHCAIKWVNSNLADEMSNLALGRLPEIIRLPKIAEAICKVYSVSLKEIKLTPKELLHMVDVFQHIYQFKVDKLTSQKLFYSAGLEKLTITAQKVNALRTESSAKSVLLEEKQRDADNALKLITESMIKAADQKLEIEKLKKSLHEEEEKINLQKRAVEEELLSVEPLIKAARDSVGEIRPETLSEIRSLRAPPAVIRDVLEAVLRLMGIFDMSWNSMKTFLGKRTVKEEIMNFNARSVSKQIRESVQELLIQKSESFDEATVKRSSAAAAPLALWVKANVQYVAILDKIAPLEQNLNYLSRSLDEACKKIKNLEVDLSNVDQVVASLKTEFATKTREAETLKLEVETAQRSIEKAAQLLHNLDKEKTRWSDQCVIIVEQIDGLIESCTVAAAFVTLLGSVNESRRIEMVNLWIKTLEVKSLTFDFTKFMTEENTRIDWQKEGLCMDSLSVENAAILFNTFITPLIADPADKVLTWLGKNLGKLEVVRNRDANIVRTLELAIRFGKMIVIADIDVLDPCLVPLIRKEFTIQGSRKVVKLCDKLVDVHDQFKLYLHTKDPFFSLPPFLSPYIATLNFATTRSGLSDQLLVVALKNEKPQLERKRTELLAKQQNLQQELVALEKRLLEELNASGGDILSNETLMQSLLATKERGEFIADSLVDITRIQDELNLECNIYRPFADFASRLYFSILNLHHLNHMYQFNLDWFVSLYVTAMSHAEVSTNGDEKINSLTNRLLKTVYETLSLAVFKRDKLSIVTYLITSVFDELFSGAAKNALFGLSLAKDITSSERPPSWLSFNVAGFTRLVGVLSSSLHKLLYTEEAKWLSWINCSSPFDDFPFNNFTSMEKLITIKYLLPEKFTDSLAHYCSSFLRMTGLDSQIFDMKDFVKIHYNSQTIALFITTPGMDPSEELRDAVKNVTNNELVEIAVGQQHEQVIMDLVKRSIENGSVLCLHNIHLTCDLLPQIQYELSKREKKSACIFFTCEETTSLPAIFLQNCTKVVFESAPGMKQNLKRNFLSVSEDLNTAKIEHIQLKLCSAWFHAVLLGRKSYIPVGWIKQYEFSVTDFKSLVNLISELFKNGRNLQCLHGLVLNSIYGQKVDNTDDLKKITLLVESFFREALISFDGKLSKQKLSNQFTIPYSNRASDYLQLIESIPDGLDSTFCELAPNSYKISQLSMHDIFDRNLSSLTAASIEPDQEGSSIMEKFREISSYWKTVVSEFQNVEWKDNITELYLVFLTGELNLGSTIADQISKDVAWFTKFLKDSSISRPSDSAFLKSLQLGETPDEWLSLWNGPSRIKAFLDTIVYKYRALKLLFEQSKSKSYLSCSSPVSLAWFYQPWTFLNVIRQLTARKNNLLIDQLHFVTCWSPSPIPTEYLNVAIEGLSVQGAQLTRDGRLIELTSDSPVFSKTPLLYIAWVREDLKKSLNDPSTTLAVPLYEDYMCEKMVINVCIPCPSSEQAKWILTGTCFLIHTEY